jgi:hypothetical protein
MSTRTHTRVHVFIDLADPYLRCDDCGVYVPRWHDDDRCGCDAGYWNEPCGHHAGVTSDCPSWGPVDGCRCIASLGFLPHAPLPIIEPEGGPHP